jgi:pimeloyl-ACP methyl ester carboxylesterase
MKPRTLLLTLATLGAVRYALGERLTTDPVMDFIGQGFTQKSLDTPVGRMNYYEKGIGKPLLFLHGIGGGASAWTWSKVAPAFTAEYRVIVPDWIGWGLSHHPNRLVLFNDYVVALTSLLEHIGEPTAVVAQGLAPGFVAAVAKEHPEWFTSLVMFTPAGGLDFGEDLFFPFFRYTFEPIARTEPVNLVFYRLLFHRRFAVAGWLKGQGFYEPTGVSTEIEDGWLYSARQTNAAYSALPFLSGALRFDMAPYIRDLNIPAAMVWGAEEQQVGLDRAR